MDWSYIAGYFDGEGTAGIYRNNRDGNRCVRLAWYNTHLESLEAIQAFMGCARLGKPRVTGLGKKPLYALAVTRRADIIRVADAMLPHLIVKRDAVMQVRDYAFHRVRPMSGGWGQATALTGDQLRHMRLVEKKSVADIAREVGVTHAAISRVLKSHGVPQVRVSTKGRPKSAESVARMRETRRRMWEDPELGARHVAAMQAGARRWREARRAEQENHA